MTEIRRRADGAHVRLEPVEVAALADLAGQVSSLLDGGVPEPGADPIRGRLFPRAYLDPTEDTAETDFQSVVHADLVRAKAEAASRLLSDLGATVGEDGDVVLDLDLAGVEAWVGALNDVRLAVGVQLKVSEEEDSGDLDPSDPRANGLATYDWLTWLQGMLIEVVLADLGE